MPLNRLNVALDYNRQIFLLGIDKETAPGYQLLQRLALKAFGRSTLKPSVAVKYKATLDSSEITMSLDTISDLAYLLYFAHPDHRQKMVEAITTVATQKNLDDLKAAVESLPTTPITQLQNHCLENSNQTAISLITSIIISKKPLDKSIQDAISLNLDNNHDIALKETAINLYLYLHYLNRKMFNARLQHAKEKSIKKSDMLSDEDKQLALTLLKSIPSDQQENYDFMIESTRLAATPFLLADLTKQIRVVINNVKQRISKLSGNLDKLKHKLASNQNDKSKELAKLQLLLQELNALKKAVKPWIKSPTEIPTASASLLVFSNSSPIASAISSSSSASSSPSPAITQSNTESLPQTSSVLTSSSCDSSSSTLSSVQASVLPTSKPPAYTLSSHNYSNNRAASSSAPISPASSLFSTPPAHPSTFFKAPGTNAAAPVATPSTTSAKASASPAQSAFFPLPSQLPLPNPTSKNAPKPPPRATVKTQPNDGSDNGRTVTPPYDFGIDNFLATPPDRKAPPLPKPKNGQ